MSGVAGRSGRKAFVPKPEQRDIVRTLTRFGIPQTEICRLVTNPQTGKPLDPKSLRKHFALEIGTGAVELMLLVGRFILATILGLPPPPGITPITDERCRARLAVLFAKTRMGWSETSVDEDRDRRRRRSEDRHRRAIRERLELPTSPARRRPLQAKRQRGVS